MYLAGKFSLSYRASLSLLRQGLKLDTIILLTNWCDEAHREVRRYNDIVCYLIIFVCTML